MKFYFKSVLFIVTLLIVKTVFPCQGPCSLSLDTTIHESTVAMAKMNELENPQMILWYAGESSLVEEGATFYKNEILSHLNRPGKFHLYDLASWEGLRKKKAKITTETKMSQRINTLKLSHIVAIHSADFLKDLATENNPEVIAYYNDIIFKDPLLFTNSIDRKINGILVQDKMPVSALKAIHGMDTAQTYSALQYLEGIYLVKRIVQASQGEENNIVFLLPNDEYKYYVTPNLSRDMNAVLSNSGILNKKINIFFKSFQFGKSIKDRPYIMKGKKVNEKTIDDFLPAFKTMEDFAK